MERLAVSADPEASISLPVHLSSSADLTRDF